ncbi:MAG: SPOR domain-containing protein [Thermoanaerobaculia bacterium]|nr:SPOR domain-containing protein [Thermoanaerobaculia bacterium]
MESSESHEPSYYEVALTNRQVLIAFVVLLTSIVAAFLSGVWIGRGGSSVARLPPAVNAAAAAPAEPALEQLTFFNGKEAGARSAAPAPASTTQPPAAVPSRDAALPAAEDLAAEERATEAMRQNLDATMAANRTVPAPSAAAPAGTRVTTQPAAAAAPAKPAPSPAKPAAAPAKEAAASRPAATGKIFVQVYSSNNAARAKEIVAQLRKAGFAVVVAETPKGGGKNHRVRVGPYAERAKADAAATKLRRDFRLETWVTDSP